MELDIDGYKARKKEWEEGRKPIEQEKSYWEDIKSKLQDARVKPGEEAAINLMRNTAPQSRGRTGCANAGQCFYKVAAG